MFAGEYYIEFESANCEGELQGYEARVKMYENSKRENMLHNVYAASSLERVRVVCGVCERTGANGEATEHRKGEKGGKRKTSDREAAGGGSVTRIGTSM